MSKTICVNCNNQIFYSEKLGWMHSHVSHLLLSEECSVCKCEEAKPKNKKLRESVEHE